MKTLRDIIENAFRELFPIWSPEDVEILARTLEHEGRLCLADKIELETERAAAISNFIAVISIKDAEIADLKQQNNRLEEALAWVKNQITGNYEDCDMDDFLKDILNKVTKELKIINGEKP